MNNSSDSVWLERIVRALDAIKGDSRALDVRFEALPPRSERPLVVRDWRITTRN